MKNRNSFLNNNIVRKNGKLVGEYSSKWTTSIIIQRIAYEPYYVYDYEWYVYEGREEWRYSKGHKIVTPLIREIKTGKEFYGYHISGHVYNQKEYIELRNFELKHGTELQAGNIKFTLHKPKHYVSKHIRTSYCGSTIGQYIHLYSENDAWKIMVFTQIRNNDCYEDVLLPTFPTLENALEFITCNENWILS